MTPSPLVQIFLMSYNRPEYIEEALNSVFAQDYPNFEVILSDNSTSEEVLDFVRSRFSQYLPTTAENLELENSQPNVKRKTLSIRRRRPSLAVLEHHNKIISEVTAPYFMMFHDDDILHPTALSKMLKAFESDAQLAAVGCNAWIIEGTKPTAKLFDQNLRQTFKLESPQQVAAHYLKPELGHVPFPSYLYRTSAVQNLQMKWSEGNKHADVSFIVKVSQSAQLCWIAEPLMSYRRHSSNGSVSIDLRAILSLARFLRKTLSLPAPRRHHGSTPSELSRLVDVYVFKHKLLWWRQNFSKTLSLSKTNSNLSTTQNRILKQSAVRDIFREIPLLLVLLWKRQSQKKQSRKDNFNLKSS